MSTASDIAAAKGLITNRSEMAIRMLALDLMRRIVVRTPVDTGAARGNWNMSIGSLDRSVDGEKTDKSGSGSIAQGMAVVADMKLGDKFFVVNSLPYIMPLEFGHSGQAPQGMVQLSVDEVSRLANHIVRALRNTA